MGAESFQKEIIGTSARECYDYLVDEAINEYGQSIYNGTIATCDFGVCTLKFDKYLKSNEKKAEDHIDFKDNGDKWRTDYVDLGVIEYELITIKKEKRKYSSKYKLKYVILEKCGDRYVQTNYSFEKIKNAEEQAIKLSLENIDKKYRVSKEYVVVEGNNINFDLIVEKKVCKNKPKVTLKPNQKLIEKHKYIFYGWAAC